MNHDIIKLLDLKDSDLIIDGPVIKKNKKILTVTKKLEPVFCPVCGSRMHSKGIYTRTVNHLSFRMVTSSFWNSNRGDGDAQIHCVTTF